MDVSGEAWEKMTLFEGLSNQSYYIHMGNKPVVFIDGNNLIHKKARAQLIVNAPAILVALIGFVEHPHGDPAMKQQASLLVADVFNI